MTGILAIHPDGREVRIEGEALRRLVQHAREWARRNPWSPLTYTEDGSIHPQFMAYTSEADIIGFGGAAGGGKTDLACGLAIQEHRKAMILRRVGTELQGILDRMEDILGSTEGYNSQKKVWKRLRHDGVRQQFEFASLPNAGDERGYQGRPHDLLVFDEAANFLEGQVRFLLGWLRSTVKGQRKRALLTFNPPTNAEGRWIVEFFAPWLEPGHPNPAKPGEIRWFATIDGKDVEVEDNRPFVLDPLTGQRRYNFNRADYRGKKRTLVITPLSRTFIPSKITDNPYLSNTGYLAMLQGLPEPLRSQMLHGDFMAGMQDDEWQVIPTQWVKEAQARWRPRSKLPPMDSLGVDVARGGKDETILSPRHGHYFATQEVHPGSFTPNGQIVAKHALMAMRDDAVIHIDVIGVGASPYDILTERGVQIVGVDVRHTSNGTDRTGKLRFKNLRSELFWRFRELLDPYNNTGAAIPPDPKLLGDLTAIRWTLRGNIICVESREDIIDRIGRSCDRASAIVLAQIDTPKMKAIQAAKLRTQRRDYDPYANIK